MQHTIHIFIDGKLVAFRDRFAAMFRSLHPEIGAPYFAALSLTRSDADEWSIMPDSNGDRQDSVSFPAETEKRSNSILNYVNALYARRVTVDAPGNKAMSIVIWAQFFSERICEPVAELVRLISNSSQNISIEINAFTHDAVNCFITDPTAQLDPNVYACNFNANLALAKKIRHSLSALRLIANRNMVGLSLNFNIDKMARVCVEHSALMSKYYSKLRTAIINSEETPLESFGLSSIIFDRKYYVNRIRTRAIIDKIEQQNIGKHYSINVLAQRTNPVMITAINNIHRFYNTETANATAILKAGGINDDAAIVAKIDGGIGQITAKLQSNLDKVLNDNSLSFFEREAQLSLLLGEDCPIFDTSAVEAGEIIIDDIIDDSIAYFQKLDTENELLANVSLKRLKDVRIEMRNIAVANRRRNEELKLLENNIAASSHARRTHMENGRYNLDGNEFRIDLNIDTKPLEITYSPHRVEESSIDLRDRFAPIRSQGRQGSCAAFAVTSVIEASLGNKLTYSPAYIYWHARENETDRLADTGASIYGVIKAATTHGVCEESKMPYNPNDTTTAPSDIATKNAANCHIIEAKTVIARIDDIRSALADGYPVIVGARIFDSFSNTTRGFIPHPSPEEVDGEGSSDGHGNHALVICGFSDRERVLLARNSWGTEFGDKGYCFIPYSYAELYFEQACIITKISDYITSQSHTVKTLDFNLNDSAIHAAILKNLIAEDNLNLSELETESKRLRAIWTNDVALLGNVNNQKKLIDAEREKLNEKQDNEKQIIRQLNAGYMSELKTFKRKCLYDIAKSFGIDLLAWMIVFFLPNHTLSWIIASVATLVTIILCATYSWKWRKKRQDLRDIIQRHAQKVDNYETYIKSLSLNAHIHGKVINDISAYNAELQQRLLSLREFNIEMSNLYEKSRNHLNEMTPETPYPFMSILTNDLLDNYYTVWGHKISGYVNFHEMINKYSSKVSMSRVIEQNENLNNSITRGLKGFSMLEYLNRINLNKWQFLPPKTSADTIIPLIDQRATPFCPYQSSFAEENNPVESYMFIAGLSSDDSRSLKRLFTLNPQMIDSDDTDSITIVKTVRYDLAI